MLAVYTCLRKMVVLLVFVALTLSLSLSEQASFPDCKVLVILPTAIGSRWSEDTVGEVLHVVELAKESVRRLPFQFNLGVKTLEVDCTSVSLVQQLLRELIPSDDNSLTVAVVGLFCKKTFQELDLIGGRLGLVQISVNTFLPDRNVGISPPRPYYYQMFPPSAAYTEALSQFMQHVGWTRVGIAFTEQQNNYYYEISKQVIGALDKHGYEPMMFKVTNDIEALREQYIMQAIKSIHISGVKIFYVLLPPLETAMLICGAYDYGLRWPHYGWIVPDINMEYFSFEKGVDCDSNAMHGIIHFQTLLSHNSSIASRFTDSSSSVQLLIPSNSVQNSSVLARAVYDAVLATAFSLNVTFSQVQNILNGQTKGSFILQSNKVRAQQQVSTVIGELLNSGVSFMGALGEISFNTSSGAAMEADISIFQMINGQHSKIGAYNPVTNASHYGVVPKERIPSDKLARVYSRLPVPLEVLLTLCMAICFLIAVVNFVLYVYYRNTPEIKASSFRLSMVIHVSSIIMMIGGQYYISLGGIVLDESLGTMACTFLNWLIYPWGDGILSTLLVKISRIQYIFYHSHGTINMKLCSDTVLLLVIASIFAGKVLILSLWSSLDIFKIADIEIYHPEPKPPYYEVEQHCVSRYYFLWLCITLGYTAILGAVLGCMVFRARHIRHKDFRDTKKITATVVVCFVAVGILVPMWWMFRAAGDTNASTTLLALLYIILPVACQTCLFWPKTIPPLMRTISAARVLKKGPFSHVRLFFEQFNQSQVSQMKFSNLSYKSSTMSTGTY